MIIPVRCFTCNKVIGHRWATYQTNYTKYKDLGDRDMDASCKALDDIELKNYCCRRMILSHIDIIDNLLLYNNIENSISD